MKQKLILSLMLGVLMFSVVSANITPGGVSYTVSYATFNGEWENGVTLMTDYYHINDALVYAKNSYPVDSGTRVKVCETTYIESKRKVCEDVIVYKEKTRRVCEVINNKRICNTEYYTVPVTKKVCTYETYQKPKTTCKYVGERLSIICTNPSGVSTNALLSENFEYQILGEESWNAIPKNGEDWSYGMKNKDVRFRVNIPLVCSPQYNINKSIVIQER